MRVIVDEGIGESSPLWQRFRAWLGHRSAEIVWLKALYPAIPDVEILDKLLTPETVLLTQDRILHNRALHQGATSLTLNAAGQLTRKPLPLDARRLRAQAPFASS
jgi:predicted nuclease of predicted toxin-antitoxin system